MQIQLGEGTVLRCVEAVLQSTTHHTARPEIGYGEKVSRYLGLKRLPERSCLAVRQRDRGCGEARGVFALERVVSCSRVEPRWRTELDLGSGEPFDDLHWSSTLGTAIKIRSVLGGGSVFFGKWFWG
jgi:hypothetical protein